MILLILERNNCSTFKQGYEMESYNNSYALIMSHAKKKCAKLKPQMLPFFRETVWLINELLAQVKHIVELLNIHLYVRFRSLEDRVLCKFYCENMNLNEPFWYQVWNPFHFYRCFEIIKSNIIVINMIAEQNIYNRRCSP